MTESYRLQTVDGIGRVPKHIWDSLANPGWQVADHGRISPKEGTDVAAFNPFTSHDFLRVCESSGCVSSKAGWLPHHLVLEDGTGATAGVVPAYLKGHSFGEYVFDHSWADAYERMGGSYYPKLQVSVPFTPATGPRLLTADGEARAALGRGIAMVADHLSLSSAHVTFANETDVDTLQTEGFLLRLDQQFHFENKGYDSYDQFLGELASRKRKALKRERRDALAPGIEIEWVTGSDLTEAHWDAFFAFYMDTGSRKWGRPYLNRTFFSQVSDAMSERILLVMAKREGRYIAGALNFIGSDRLYGRNWGCIEDHPFLHFEVCYHQAIDFAIHRKLAIVEAGAQGEHKLARGYLPVTTRSAHYLPDAKFRRAVAHYLEQERLAVLETADAFAAQGPFRRGDLLQDD
ncbi:GNAT family N-acetyltransferase [Oryzibacter oryziterrae]|uniref:GNAT family N-acetyltransferase n=1 Tax=Oryzibacter oryziterrae TaxID=2766474 RepID=UPI001F3B8BB5|nr:GNAT family N-acetyltransferase [Oryzibacter oryziterrae]